MAANREFVGGVGMRANTTADMMTFEVAAKRIDASGSTVSAKQAEFTIDASMACRADAVNPVELLIITVKMGTKLIGEVRRANRD